MSSLLTSIPKQPSEKKPGQLTKEQLLQFFDRGYLVLEEFFDTEKDLEPVKRALDERVSHVADALYKGYKIKDAHETVGHMDRLTFLEKEFPGATVLFHKYGIKSSKGFRELWTNPKLLAVMEQLVGPDIAINPGWNLRPKTPDNQAHIVPWHQDAAYREKEADETLIVTAWVPLLDANANNGCLEIVPDVHKNGKIGSHKGMWGETWYIYMEDDDVLALGRDPKAESVVCPIPYGGVLLFNGYIPHRSLPNLSNEIRWSLDFRYQSSKLPLGGFGRPAANVLENRKIVENPDWAEFDGHEWYDWSEDPFDTTINPARWGARWPRAHENRHTVNWKYDL